MMSELKKRLGRVKENESMAEYTSFRIGGPARYFFVARSSDDIMRSVTAAVELELPYFILGSGSNLLVADAGFPGLVIKLENKKFEIKNGMVSVGAGVILDELIGALVDQGLVGMEKMSGIPGTVGGAVRGNAGAFGQEIKDRVSWVKVCQVSGVRCQVSEFTNAQCEFNYRESIFKYNTNLIVLECELKFEQGDLEELKRVRQETIQKRALRYPPEPSCGSTFKNIKFDIVGTKYMIRGAGQEIPEAIASKLPAHCVEWKTLPAGWLTNELGLAGTKIGGAMLAREHGNFIINIGGAKAQDVVALMRLIKQKVRATYGFELEAEVQPVGF